MKTPRTRVKGMLRLLFLHSAERAIALKRDGYACVDCGLKQSKKRDHVVKVQVHHKEGIEWDELINLIYKYILCDPDELETVCVECHNKKE